MTICLDSLAIQLFRVHVHDNSLVDVVLWLAFFKMSQSFRKMVVQDYSLMSKFSYKEVLLFNLFLKR